MNAAKLLGSLLGKNSMNSGILGKLLGGGGQGGGLAGMLGGLLKSGKGGIGSLLGGIMGGGSEEAEESHAAVAVADPPQEVADGQAKILIRAMCNAAKSDGKFDEAEKEAILSRLGEIEQDEIDFLQNELSQPLDVQGFAAEVPGDLKTEVYAVSVMAIKIDEQSEAQYLGDLAQALGLEPAACNDIHAKLGAPEIFRA